MYTYIYICSYSPGIFPWFSRQKPMAFWGSAYGSPKLCSLYLLGASWGPAIAQGAVWRLMLPMMLHVPRWVFVEGERFFGGWMVVWGGWYEENWISMNNYYIYIYLWISMNIYIYIYEWYWHIWKKTQIQLFILEKLYTIVVVPTRQSACPSSSEGGRLDGLWWMREKSPWVIGHNKPYTSH